MTPTTAPHAITARTVTTTVPRTGAGPRPTRPGPGHPPTRRPQRARPTTAPVDLPPTQQRAAAERLADALGRWYLDALAGRVEVRQLRRLLTPTAEHRVLAAVLRARAAHRLGGPRPGTVLDVRRVVVQPAGDRFEAVALVDDGVRTTAVAAVLHPTTDGWRVSDLARPDDGVPALPAPLLREDGADYTA